MTPDEQKNKALSITLQGSLLDLILGLVKIFAGIFSNSFALISDGIHSLSDLLSDGFVLIITFFSREAPDSEHPYGHGRFETIGTIVIGLFLFFIAAMIFYDGVKRLGVDSPEHLKPGLLALIIASISIAAKEWIYHRTRKVALEINSSLLLANAWHSRTDALSSLVVLVGLFASMLGFPVADIIAALVVALMIAKIAWTLVSDSLIELVDTALPMKKIDLITRHIKKIDGIIDAHSLRSRRHGNEVLLDIHIQVSSMITVSEGHYLADKTSAAILEEFNEVKDILVHIDPEFDEDAVLEASSASPALPSREEAIKQIQYCCKDILISKKITKINLHYLNKQILAELYIDSGDIDKQLAIQIKHSTQTLKWLKSLQIYGCF